MELFMIASKINKICAKFSSQIFLYHSTYSQLPSDLSREIHNVTPVEMYKQLVWLKNNFDIVSIDELLFNNESRGKAAITFDDAYKSIFDEAIPIFKSLNIPCTIFINGCTLDKKVFWRDKVRYIINNSLVHDFIIKNLDYCQVNDINVNNFYARTKHRFINSIEVDNLLDKYLIDNNIDLKSISYCIDDDDMLSRDDLVTYGSHTYSHYVMSSLTNEQQHSEILNNIKCFDKFNIKQSKVFSIPFGGESSFNSTTIRLLDQHGYNAFLYSRNKINLECIHKYNKEGELSMLFGDRYMPKSTFSSFQRQVLSLNSRAMLNI
jgi:peptidoglycan/xylan/chitin deacetylase (PgdA/CDA1 family)